MDLLFLPEKLTSLKASARRFSRVSMEQRGKSCPSAGRLEAEPGPTRAVRVTVGPAPFAGPKPEPPGWAGADPGSRSLGFPRLSPSTLTGAATSHPGQSDRGKGCLAGRGTLRQAGVRACGPRLWGPVLGGHASFPLRRQGEKLGKREQLQWGTSSHTRLQGSLWLCQSAGQLPRMCGLLATACPTHSRL